MALVFTDGFDSYQGSQILAKWTQGSSQTAILGGPGRLGYGQYIVLSGGGDFYGRFVGSLTTLTFGFAYYFAGSSFSTGGPIAYFADVNNVTLGTLGVNGAGELTYAGFNSTAVIPTNAWCYIEISVTLSAATSGSVTVRLNGQTVLTQSSVTTSANSNPCATVYITSTNIAGSQFFDDLYILNSTAPNNTFLGDVKILPLYPTGNGRISGFSRFGGTSSGNYTAVNEVPPDGDSSYVYTSTAGTEDAYTITALSNVTSVVAVQVSAYARKDDTPSRVLGLGVGNGTTENFDSGHSLNTSYTYVLRQMDQNPLTSAAWAVTDFTTLQLAQELIS